jgi:hypothetical protein
MPRPTWSTGALLGADSPLPIDRPFTSAEAGAEGAGSKLLTALVGSGHLRRVLHGVYVATQVPDSLGMRARALKLVVPEHCVVVDRTACWLHVVDALPRRAAYEMPEIELYSTRASRTRRTGVSSGVRDLRPGDVQVIDGLRVTTKLRTACDVGRLVWRYDAIGALDGLVRAGLAPDELRDAVSRYKGYRGVLQLRQLVPLIDPLAESMPESALRLHWHEADLPWPECQIWVHDDDGRPVFRIDLGHRDVRYGAEYFGAMFHGEDESANDEARLEWLGRRAWVMDVFRSAQVYGMEPHPGDTLHAGFRRARASLGVGATTYIDLSR